MTALLWAAAVLLALSFICLSLSCLLGARK